MVLPSATQGVMTLKGYVLNGWEDFTEASLRPNPYDTLVHYYSGIEQTGIVGASRRTSSGGFQPQIHAVENIFIVTGSLATTIYGVVYEQTTIDI